MDNGRCSHLCLPKYGRVGSTDSESTCFCPHGSKLLKDNRTCDTNGKTHHLTSEAYVHTKIFNIN